MPTIPHSLDPLFHPKTVAVVGASGTPGTVGSILVHNLLTNPGFESGLAGWTVTPSGTTQGTGPAPWQGGQLLRPRPQRYDPRSDD